MAIFYRISNYRLDITQTCPASKEIAEVAHTYVVIIDYANRIKAYVKYKYITSIEKLHHPKINLQAASMLNFE